MNVVGKAEHKLVIAVVILHCNLGGGIAVSCREVQHVGVNYFKTFFLVYIAYKALYAALIMEGFFSYVVRVAGINKVNFHSRVKEGLLAQALAKHVIVVFQSFKNLSVRFEYNRRAGFGRISHDLKVGYGSASFKTLAIDMLAVFYFNLKPFGKGVYYRGSDAVQAAGNLISASAELTAGVQHGKYHRNSRNSQLVMYSYRNAAPVVSHFNYIAGKNFNVNIGTIPRKSLVNSVIHNLVNKMVKTLWTC